MSVITIQKYDSSFKNLWDEFVAKAQNSTFLFYRDFMEYHQDRFTDHSLLVLENQKIIALLPANISQNKVFSHQGLTYGGLLYKDLKLAKVLTLWQAVLEYFHNLQVTSIQIKTIPSIYCRKPSEELLYLLFVSEAKLIRRDALAVIQNGLVSITKGRMEGIQKGIQNQLVVKEESDFSSFWTQILIPNLQQKHQAAPVHTLEEIHYLYSKFPNNIRQFNVYYKDTIVAGTTIFESEVVAHAQYISANAKKTELGSLDFLYHHLITTVFASKKYFDFGISNEAQGTKLNNGLSFWKESFGASAVVQDFYEVATSNYKLLDNVIL